MNKLQPASHCLYITLHIIDHTSSILNLEHKVMGYEVVSYQPIRICESIIIYVTISSRSINSTSHIQVFCEVNKHVQISVAATGATSTLSTKMSTLYACFFHLTENLTNTSFHFISVVSFFTARCT